MPYCYGVTNHSPEQVAKWLSRFDVSYEDISFLPSNKYLPVGKKSGRIKEYIFFLMSKDAYNNLDILNQKEYQHHKIFIFASLLKLSEFEGMTVLDSDNLNSDPLSFKGKKKLSEEKFKMAENHPLSVKNENFLLNVIENIKVGSLLTPLMTFIYTLPSSSHQKPLKTVIANWIYFNGTEDNLDCLLDFLSQKISITPRVRSKFKSILLSPAGKKYQQAFSLYRKSKSVTLAVKEFNVNAYEMNYIKSVIEAYNKYCLLEKETVDYLFEILEVEETEDA